MHFNFGCIRFISVFNCSQWQPQWWQKWCTSNCLLLIRWWDIGVFPTVCTVKWTFCWTCVECIIMTYFATIGQTADLAAGTKLNHNQIHKIDKRHGLNLLHPVPSYLFLVIVFMRLSTVIFPVLCLHVGFWWLDFQVGGLAMIVSWSVASTKIHVWWYFKCYHLEHTSLPAATPFITYFK